MCIQIQDGSLDCLKKDDEQESIQVGCLSLVDGGGCCTGVGGDVVWCWKSAVQEGRCCP